MTQISVTPSTQGTISKKPGKINASPKKSSKLNSIQPKSVDNSKHAPNVAQLDLNYQIQEGLRIVRSAVDKTKHQSNAASPPRSNKPQSASSSRARYANHYVAKSADSNRKSSIKPSQKPSLFDTLKKSEKTAFTSNPVTNIPISLPEAHPTPSTIDAGQITNQINSQLLEQPILDEFIKSPRNVWDFIDHNPSMAAEILASKKEVVAAKIIEAHDARLKKKHDKERQKLLEKSKKQLSKTATIKQKLIKEIESQSIKLASTKVSHQSTSSSSSKQHLSTNEKSKGSKRTKKSAKVKKTAAHILPTLNAISQLSSINQSPEPTPIPNSYLTNPAELQSMNVAAEQPQKAEAPLIQPPPMQIQEAAETKSQTNEKEEVVNHQITTFHFDILILYASNHIITDT